jgi:hypothetical protein
MRKSSSFAALIFIVILAIGAALAFAMYGVTANPESVGINRHVVGDERALQERRTANPSWPRVLQAASRGVA